MDTPTPQPALAQTAALQPVQATSETEAPLRRAAREFETMFLAQMLKQAGLGEPPEAFGGGAGETAFSSLLVREQARLMAEQGGIGLAERLFEALVERSGAE